MSEMETLAQVNPALDAYRQQGTALAVRHAQAQARLDVSCGLYPYGVGLREAKDRADGTGGVAAPGYPAGALGTYNRISWIKAYREAYAPLLEAHKALEGLRGAEEVALLAYQDARVARIRAERQVGLAPAEDAE